MMTIVSGLICDRAYRVTDGRVVAAGILPGLVYLRQGEAIQVDAVIQVAHLDAGPVPFELRILVDGSLHAQQTIKARSAPPALIGIEAHRIPINATNRLLEIMLREGLGDWSTAVKLAIETQKGVETAQDVRQGALTS